MAPSATISLASGRRTMFTLMSTMVAHLAGNTADAGVRQTLKHGPWRGDTAWLTVIRRQSVEFTITVLPVTASARPAVVVLP